MWIPVLTDIYFYPLLNSSQIDTTEIPVKITRNGFQIVSHFSWHTIMQISDSSALFGNKVRGYPTSAGCQDRSLYVPWQELLHRFQPVWQKCCYFSCWLKKQIESSQIFIQKWHCADISQPFEGSFMSFFCLFVFHIPETRFLLLKLMCFEEALSAFIHVFS